MKQLVYSGVRKTSDKMFAIDYTYNYPQDIIDIVEPQFYQSMHNNDIYTFGYKFNDDIDSKTRTEFIHAVKQLGPDPLTDKQLEQFIKRPLKYLNNYINLYHIDCFVYPLSGRSPLVSKMIRCIGDCTSREMSKCSFEFVKTAPNFTGFLDFTTSEEIERFSKLQGANILVVDDINTTGSTLNEILRKLSEVNQNCNIYVYTLIGN